MKYYIEDYFTDEIIDVVSSFDEAVKICSTHEGSLITLDNDEILYTNVELPF